MKIESLDDLRDHCLIVPGTDCWMWLGRIRRDGYAQVWYRGGEVYVHRIAVMLSGRAYPAGMYTDHVCRIRSCVNPAHLQIVTSRENARRGYVGEAAGLRSLVKTHCPRQHPYDEGNTRYTPNGSRRCRKCERQRYLAQKVLS